MKRRIEIPLEKKWARLKKSLADEMLTDAYSDDEIDTFIREAGGDPEAMERRSIKKARDVWALWKGSSTDKENSAAAHSQPQTANLFECRNEGKDNSTRQGKFLFSRGDRQSNLIARTATALDRDRQREHWVRAILEDAGAIELECDYVLPCKLHSDIHVNIAKICSSETSLASIASALDEALAKETFDTVVSTGWALAMIARRLVLAHAKQGLNIQHVIIEGYDPNILEEITLSANMSETLTRLEFSVG